MTDSELEQKFTGLAEAVIGPRRTREVIEMSWGVERLPDVGALARAAREAVPKRCCWDYCHRNSLFPSRLLTRQSSKIYSSSRVRNEEIALKQSHQARFAYQIGAVGEAGLPDAELYEEALADAELIHRLGYNAAWVIEHHFSDYYPQPNPLMLLSHIAAKVPRAGLGTAVMVLPWYNPIRFAEDIAMLCRR